MALQVIATEEASTPGESGKNKKVISIIVVIVVVIVVIIVVVSIIIPFVDHHLLKCLCQGTTTMRCTPRR